MSSETSMAPPNERIIFIDALRGYAILMMLQGHTIGVVLREDLQDNRYPAHFLWLYLKGLTAPAFFAAAGLIFAFLMVRAEALGSSRLAKGIKRGLWLMVLGWILQIDLSEVRDLFSPKLSEGLRFLGKTHVLHTIGLSLIAMVLLWLICCRSGRAFAIACVIVGQIALLIGPWMETWHVEGGWQRVLATFLAREYAAFPLLPWMGYTFTGAGLGVLAWETKWYRRRRSFGVIALLGLLLMACSGPITQGFWFLCGGVPEGLQASVLSGRYWRSGEVLVLMGLVGLLCDFVLRKGWADTLPVRIFTTCGQETLSIYFLHVIVVYSALFGFGLSTTCAFKFGVMGSLTIALLIEAAFILLAMKLSTLRKKWPWLGMLR